MNISLHYSVELLHYQIGARARFAPSRLSHVTFVRIFIERVDYTSTCPLVLPPCRQATGRSTNVGTSVLRR